MSNESRVVVLAGGKGTRLVPYTTVLPKPLMPMGDMPILEVMLLQLRRDGFTRVTISVGHLADLIRAFCGNGSKWAMNIEYAMEDRPLGTIGPLRLMDGLGDDFIVMNGDLLTDLSYADLLAFHREGDQVATIGTTIRQVQVSLGVLECDHDQRVIGFHEKPTAQYRVSMGVYVFNRAILKLVPRNRPYGFDNLMVDLLARGLPVRAYDFQGLWYDIGRHEDYETALSEFEQRREQFLHACDAGKAARYEMEDLALRA
jgi:NDP-sugar pyrophosphorylase family protein